MTDHSHLKLSLIEQLNETTIHSEQIALIYNNQIITYGEFYRRTNQMAHWLIEQQIHPGDFIALLLEPGIEYIITIVAIVKAGAVYVPLDIQAPATRLHEIIDDASPKMVITNEHYFQDIKTCSFTINLIKKITIQATSYCFNPPNVTIQSNNPIYMMYTSGSTGKPKGVLIEHHAVFNLVSIDNYAEINSQCIIGQFSNLAFDGSTFEIWSALLHGVPLVIIPKETRTNPNQLKEYIEHLGINTLFLPTGFFHQLIKTVPNSLDQISTLVFGGEQVNAALIKQFLSYRNEKIKPLKLINGYGPTEATTFTCRHIMNEQHTMNELQLSSIGSPIKNVRLYILDEQLKEVDEGELYISGANLALCYHNSIEQNKQKFIKNPFSHEPVYNRLYKTGDKARRLPTGEYQCLGRLDDQVKIGGFRIHLNEVELELLKHEAIALACVVVEVGGGNHQILTAYIVFSNTEYNISGDVLREYLAHTLPIYMLPAKFVQVQEFPLTAVGKVDKNKLSQIEHRDLSVHIDASDVHFTEQTIKSIWHDLLNTKNINIHKNFFDLGANSLLLSEACHVINKKLHTNIEISDLLSHPTISKLTHFLEGDLDIIQSKREKPVSLNTEIAIIGMSCRAPKSPDLNSFWSNLCAGKDCLSRFQDTNQEDYIPVRGTLADIELFDASFFGFSPADAQILDPQHRVFLEVVWEALEHAGIAPNKNDAQLICVYAGMTDSTYLIKHLLKNSDFCTDHDSFQQRIATSLGMLSTLISYKLNLKGRSININAACSTGLLAVEQACQDLMLGYSDTAIAGASSIVVPQNEGYHYHPGSILSKDGYCRPFDINANGTVFSNSTGAVILKRLEDAQKEGHTIYGIITGRGVNNDGSDKLGFTAPSMSGQITCIKEALSHAHIKAQQLGLLEAHGTATLLGDLVEVAALKQVFADSEHTSFCALSSVKANIGHTDVASGIMSLIKTTLCLYHQIIPPQIHFTASNPELHLEQSPFYINKELKEWESKETRYAGVSSFGVGGTNVHLIVKEHWAAPEKELKEHHQERLFLFSAKSTQALNAYEQQFSTHMKHHVNSPNQWVNSAYTLYRGREDFDYRNFAVASNVSSLIKELETKTPHLITDEIDYNMIWMFSGQGSQYHHMAMELFNNNTIFKKYVLRGVELANAYLHINLLELINNKEQNILHKTQYAQPALFIIEYALAQLLIECGLHPNVLIGHSLGEYTAACIAEVFSFEDGLALVCERGLLMSQAPEGAMVAVICNAEQAKRYEQEASIEIAVHNTEEHYVFSGSLDAVNTLEHLLNKEQTPYQKLKVSHAFHSSLMESIEAPFKSIFENIHLSLPKIPIISNVTGTWLSAQEATSPDYWYRHLRTTVQFSKGIDLLNKDKHSIFLEIGPGHTLTQFVTAKKKHLECIASTLPNHYQKNTDSYQLLSALGFLWAKGIPINLAPLMEHQKQLIALPTYAFQKQKYWIEADGVTTEFIKKAKDSEDNEPSHLLNHQEEPLNALQHKVRSLFKRSLGLNRIALEDNYFDLGGHSLAAVKMLNSINKHYGTSLSIQHLYQHPTIAQISTLIESQEPLTPPTIIPLKKRANANKTIFLCHPISGVVTSLNELAQHFPDTYSVFGIQDPSVSSGILLQDSIESIATHYVEALLQEQKEGSYYLIGYSFGGNIVYEMAHQLTARGKKINLLCLIDSWAKHPSTIDLESELTSFPTTNTPSPLHFIELSKQRLRLLLRHTPSQMQQEMILFKAKKTLPSYTPIDHPVNYWNMFNLGNVSCHPIDCTHEQIITGNNALEMAQSLIHYELHERDS